MKQEYPLNWPVGWKRTPTAERSAGSFGTRRDGGPIRAVTLFEAITRALDSLYRMGVKTDDIRISSNHATRRDGSPYMRAPPIIDPGVAIYWKLKGKPERCMAIDRYDTIAANLAAISASLEALRSVERHGGSLILDRAFTGFAALAAPEQWFQVLGVGVDASREEIDQAYRHLASAHHPDKSNGSADLMARINRARDQGLEQFT